MCNERKREREREHMYMYMYIHCTLALRMVARACETWSATSKGSLGRMMVSGIRT